MNQKKYTFKLIAEKKGGYSILSQDYLGLVSQADTKEQVVPMATEALELMLEHPAPPELLAGTKIKYPQKNQFQLVVDMETRKVVDSIFP
jgi:predicted RNase H-like HicB family nuclease